VNQTWGQVIRCYVPPLHDDWVQRLTDVEFAINAAVSTSTNIHPFKATVGFEPTSPTTATFEDNEPNSTLPEQVKILLEMHRLAHDRVKATQAHVQESANRHRLQVPLHLAIKVSSRRRIYDSYSNHVLNYETAILDHFLRRFPRLRFNLSYPMEYRFTMLYTPFYWRNRI
jgi:hypothetical protein